MKNNDYGLKEPLRAYPDSPVMEQKSEITSTIPWTGTEEGIDKYVRETTKCRQITINPLDTGFIVTVGCKTLAIEKKEKLIELFTSYLTNPALTEKDYLSGKLF